MALIDELKEKLKAVEAYIDARHSQIREHGAAVEDLERQRWDLDIAIAALAPTELVVTEITKEDAVEQLASEEDEVFADAYAAEIISDLTGDPAIEPESGLHGEAVEEAPALNEQMQDEREEGYAPVTNPEADAIASGIAYYSPAEQRARAAPWPGLGSLFGNKPKVDA